MFDRLLLKLLTMLLYEASLRFLHDYEYIDSTVSGGDQTARERT